MRAPPLSILSPDGRLLIFDAIEEVSYSPSVRVSSHPLETGEQVSDHASVDPLVMSATALISASPLDIARVPGVVQGPSSSTGLPAGGRARLDAVVSLLRSFQGVPLVISTTRGTYLDCLLTRWAHKDTKLQALRFALSFQQVRFADSQEVVIEVPAPAPSEEAGASGQTDTGEQATADTGDGSGTDTAEEDQDQSALAAIYDAVEGE